VTDLRVGVVGAGRIGSLHARIVAEDTPGAVLAAVADVHAPSAVSVAARFRVPAMGVEELLPNPNVDAVAICTSTDSHVDLIVAAARAGKAVFCEKPISLDLPAVDRALAAVADAGVPFMVGFNRRFDPAHRSVHDAVIEGVVGDVHLARISSRDPSPPPLDYIRVSGGIFVDMMIHDFDMARFVVGSPVVEVYAKGAVLIDPAIGAAGDFDTASVMLTHATGAVTMIDNSRQAVYGYDQRVEVFGSLGMAASENPDVHSGITITRDGLRGQVIPHFFLERYAESYRREWRAFIDYVRDGGPSPVPGSDARAPVVLGLAAGESARTGAPVRVTEG
jgi:myo-inositol 2-dehydrogenase/D-chiro-inositol 1-dehydrogenase